MAGQFDWRTRAYIRRNTLSAKEFIRQLRYRQLGIVPRIHRKLRWIHICKSAGAPGFDQLYSLHGTPDPTHFFFFAATAPTVTYTLGPTLALLVAVRIHPGPAGPWGMTDGDGELATRGFIR